MPEAVAIRQVIPVQRVDNSLKAFKTSAGAAPRWPCRHQDDGSPNGLIRGCLVNEPIDFCSAGDKRYNTDVARVQSLAPGLEMSVAIRQKDCS